MNRAPQSSYRLLILLGVTIFVAEAGIINLLHLLSLSSWVELFMDSIFLIIVIFPVLYSFVFRPMNLYISELKKTMEELICRADTALYQAKEKRRNRVEAAL